MATLLVIIFAFLVGLSAGYCIGWDTAEENYNEQQQ